MKQANATHHLYRKLLPLFLFLLWISFPLQAQFRPHEQLGELFEAVQLKPVFPDSKTFVDCTPLAAPDVILQAYRQQKNQPGFDLDAFVLKYFRLPPTPATNFHSDTSQSVVQHIEKLWPVLTRERGSDSSSLIPLPNPYIVPGGRFREIYYWDTYFTMLGLQASSEVELIEYMVDNFAYLIQKTGHIPNGNRTYYVTRSQPPFFALMLGILAYERGNSILAKYAPALRQEYDFWMEGAETLTTANPAHRRVVRLQDGSILNRYWDDKPTPRPEAYKEDVHLAQESGRNKEEVYRNLKAAAESGWDFSSRWFADGQNLRTIRTVELIPVDLNALLYHTELTLAQAAKLNNNRKEERLFRKRAEARKKALLRYCWSPKDNFFFDYDFTQDAVSGIPTLAAAFPLYFRMADKQQAEAVANRLQKDFLKPGGLVTTLSHTGQQWDAPNGWAPLQWISIMGLRNYNHTALADSIATNWINLNTSVFKSTGKLVEKYNVENTTLEAGGGEYPTQDGFGWTNGVLLRLLVSQAGKK